MQPTPVVSGGDPDGETVGEAELDPSTGLPVSATTYLDLVEGNRLQIRAGLDLHTDDGWVDISDDLVPDGSVVEGGSFRTVHRTCRLRLSRQLDWGRDRVRPWMELWGVDGHVADGDVMVDAPRARVDLGVYVLSTPDTVAGVDPPVWTVECFDLLEVLDDPYGATFVALQGAGHVATALQLVEAAGLPAQFTSTGDDEALASDWVFPIDEDWTTLGIVNALLTAAGRRAVWVDWSGVLRSEPYDTPADRPSEWLYDTAAVSTTVGEMRTLTRDFFDTPNRWIFIRDDPEGGAPSEGDGIYTVVNVADGPTSQQARGRTISKVVRLQASSQSALVTQGDRTVESDRTITEEFTSLQVGPNPAHWHMDVIRLVDGDLGFDRKCLVRSWRLPLDGSDMTLDVRAV